MSGKAKKRHSIKLKIEYLEEIQRERNINENKLGEVSELGYSQIYRNKQVGTGVSGEFIAGILTAFPDKKFDDFFFVV